MASTSFDQLSDKQFILILTNELLQLNKNDELILVDVFCTINYKKESVFITGVR